MMENENRQDDVWMKSDSVYVYGAGQYAQHLYFFLMGKNITINKFIVADKSKNPDVLKNIEVCSLDEALAEKNVFETPILIALKDGADIIRLKLNKLGMKKVYVPYTTYKDEILNCEKLFVKNEFNKNNRGYSLVMDYKFQEPGQIYITKKGEQAALCRSANKIAAIETFVHTFDFNVYEEMYGHFERLELCPCLSNADSKVKLEIYMASSHLDNFDVSTFDNQGVLIPIQVGAALTAERKGFQTDDTGDNISLKNGNYCECTALYWVWKNTSDQDYVGLCHYRRRFASLQLIKKAVATENIDVISMIPEFTEASLRSFFVPRFLTEQDWDCMKNFVIAYDSAYKKIFETYENGHFYLACNLIIYKRNIFEQYCEFAFYVAFQMEEYYKKMGVVKNNRYIGYIFENLSSLFLMKHREEFNVKYVDMEFVNIRKREDENNYG